MQKPLVHIPMTIFGRQMDALREYVRTVEAVGGLPAYDGWEDLVLEDCERASNIIVGLLERPLVNELLDCEVVGDIDMETTEIRSG